MAQQFATELQLNHWVQQAALDYEQINTAFYLAGRIAPEVPVQARFGQFWENMHGRNYLVDPGRAPGAKAGKVELKFQAGASYQTEHKEHREAVTDEEVEASQMEFGLDRFRAAAENLTALQLANVEAKVTALFMSCDWYTRDYDATLGYYDDYSDQVVTLTSGDHWNQSTSHPFEQIMAAREWFSKNSYVVPNTLIIPEVTALYLREHPDYKSEYSVLKDMFAIGDVNVQIRGLDVVVARAKVGKADGTLVPYCQDVWIGRVDSWGGTFMGHAAQPIYTNGHAVGTRIVRDEDTYSSDVISSYGERAAIIPRVGGSVAGFLIHNPLEAGA